MFNINIRGNSFNYRGTLATIVTDSVATEYATFSFDDSWKGLSKWACFKNNDTELHVLLKSDDEAVTIPWEVMADSGILYIGALGMKEDAVVKPTVWVAVANVVEGVSTEGAEPEPPTPSEIQQVLDVAEQAKNIAASAAGPASEAAAAANAAAERASSAASEATTAAESANAAIEQVEGIIAESENFVKCHRTTIEIQTPAWDIQPTTLPVTVPYMVISIDGYTTGGGPARIYIENRVDLTQVQVGDKLLWWGDASNNPTVESIRNNVFDTIETVAVDGSNITITANGGSAFTSSDITYADIRSNGNEPLLSDFDTWKNAAYYITLKDTDGTALSDGQFKLCTAYDGYADAIDQIFTISGKTLSENMAVDFKTISEDRTSFEMRDAGVKSINILTKNNKSQRYVFSVFHNYMTANKPGGKYLYLQDDIGKALRSSALYQSSTGKYTGTSGFLLPIVDSRVGSFGQLGYTITMNRTKVGLNVSLHCLRVYENQRVTYDNNGYSDCSAGTEDFNSMELNEFMLFSNNAYYFRNGTSITLEEFI